MRSASSAGHSGTTPAADDMMDHQHVDADGTGQDGIGAPGRVCCKEPVVLIPHWIKTGRQGNIRPDGRCSRWPGPWNLQEGIGW